MKLKYMFNTDLYLGDIRNIRDIRVEKSWSGSSFETIANIKNDDLNTTEEIVLATHKNRNDAQEYFTEIVKRYVDQLHMLEESK